MNGYLIEKFIKEGHLKSSQIIAAFKKIKRADFVSEETKREYGEEGVADYDAPLPIGFGQTISQPYTVALMLELLQPQEGHKIMDVGSGSGWQTAMLCHIVGEKGFVYAIERLADLKEFGENNVKKYDFKNVEFICGDGTKGLADQAPFDRIIAAAAGREIPQAWKDQLKINGRLVVPVKDKIKLLIKKSEKEFEEQVFHGFAFVPLISDK